MSDRQARVEARGDTRGFAFAELFLQALEGLRPHEEDLPTCATTHHTFPGSFSAVSKRNFATKYAFFQFFRDLQNYLGDFLKKLQNLQEKIKKSQKNCFCEIPVFLKKRC